MGYEIQLDTFQGPLELLYQLVKKNRIEISEISLARVTEQYLQYVEKLNELNLNNLSEFMVIAAELIQIKTKALLPDDNTKNEEENDTNLIERLREYHYFKKVSQILRDYEEETAKMFTRQVDISTLIDDNQEINIDIDFKELLESYKKILQVKNKSINKEKDEEPEKYLWQEFNMEEVKIEDKSEYIIEHLQKAPAGLSFRELIVNRKNRMEIVVTFLSILELARMKKIRLNQDKIFSNIHLI